MKILDTEIPDVKIIEPAVYEDERGHFYEVYNAQKFEEEMGFRPEFQQLNESFSKKGTIRGLHLQQGKSSQSKLVRVVVGKVLDIAVDCRPTSHFFGKHVAFELSGDDHRQLFIPKGFAHGFQVLSDYCILTYQVDAPYDPNSEVIIYAMDPALEIKWAKFNENFMSEKDSSAMFFSRIFSEFL